MSGALSGLRVLDLSDSIAGQFAGRMLADFGAVVTLVDEGHFAKARERIDAALALHGTPAGKRSALAFERERMRRILLDFTLDADEVKARVRKQIPDLNDVEFADFTIELCDATPSYIEENKEEWLDVPGQWCPWSAVVISVTER